tara:strand:+ start:394 stop:648 length:255 start_codon:yes stop_codon:yes gene_type:complete
MFSDVDMMRQTRKEMAKVLKGEMQNVSGRNVSGRAARSPRIPGHGNVWGPIDAAVRAAAREKAAREAREQAARDKSFENADWAL